MALYDITLTLTEELPTWPGDPPLQLEQISSIAAGEMANLTRFSSSLHIGTHVDAPDHFLDNGQTVEQIPLDLMVGSARVTAVSAEQAISAEDLRRAGVQPGLERILIQTRNSAFWKDHPLVFREDYLALAPDAARYLVECGVRVVGVDYLSVAPFQDQETTHQILLGAGILVIEGLNLSGIKPGEYTLLCLPLKIRAADGAPARVLLQDCESQGD